MRTNLLLLWSLLLLCPYRSLIAQEQFIEQRLDPIYQDLETRFEIQGTVIQIFNSDSVLLKKNYGVQDHSSKVPMNDSSLFYLSDLTKTVIAAAVQNEIQKKTVHPDSSISNYLHHLDKNATQVGSVTIHELLYHISGIQNDRYGMVKDDMDKEKARNQKEPQPASKFTKKIKGNTIPFDTLKAVEYSDINYMLLVDVVETVSNSTFSEYCQTTFFDPLELESASFSHIKNQHLVTPYTQYARSADSTVMATNRTFKQASPYHRNNAYVEGLSMKAQDLTKWMQYFLALNNATYQGGAPSLNTKEMWTSKSKIDVINYWTINVLKGDLAMGWHPKTILGEDIVMTFSQEQGFKHCCFLLPERNIGVTVLTNTNRCPSPGIGYAILEILIEEELIN
ncbi:serine hydrolase domain-containing protein [Flammeovirga aprica]|uniref:Serine hydrolase n=1 Tax=Flammeovirga aprica JL-4 TaxID=694437 RepID=A0A7X9RVA7_9BACT|nr:serine hydrolase [Flammeovirga aprica]NME69353.1 serine hydrolase [Flammeovirga aprica JL-4]